MKPTIRVVLLSLALTVYGGVALTSPASADETASRQVARAEKAAGVSSDDKESTPPAVSASGANTVSAMIAGKRLQVGLRGADKPTVTITGEHTIVNGQRVKYAFDQLTGDSGRMSAVLSSRTSTQPSWNFGQGTSLELMQDGGVILSQGGRPIGLIDAPWAVDAAGKKLPTHYEISGSTLTQVVGYPRGTAFPVVADPTWKVYPWYVRVTFSQRESHAIVGGGAGACAAILLGAPLPAKVIGAACGIIVGAYAGALSVPNSCLTVKIYPLTGGLHSGTVHRC